LSTGIAFVVGQVAFEQVQPLIDLARQAQFLAHEVYGADAAAVGGPAPVGHFKMDVAAAEHRLGLRFPAAFCLQAARDSLLAVAQDFGVGSVHSKCHFSLGLVSLITCQQIQD
jgi:hypothetical protein